MQHVFGGRDIRTQGPVFEKKPMEFEHIRVFTRDESRGAQEPTAFEWRSERFEVVRVVDRWLEGRMDSTRLPLRYYRVETAGGGVYILRYHEFFTAWSIRVP